jgi:uncharacterized membrane protein YgaE (UPF0421/DUF939 family)
MKTLIGVLVAMVVAAMAVGPSLYVLDRSLSKVHQTFDTITIRR